MDFNTKDISEKIGIREDDILNVYMIGSRIYHTDSYNSDYDYLVITKKTINNEEYRRGILNIHVYTIDHYQDMLNQQKIQFLEGFFSPKKLKELYFFSWTMDKEKFIKGIIENSNKSFKMYNKNIEDNPELASKKLFHSIRIFGFAEQLLKYGRITDFSSETKTWMEIHNKNLLNDNLGSHEEKRTELLLRFQTMLNNI